MKIARLVEVEVMSDQVVCVGPGLLKSNPPTATQVCIVVVLRSVKEGIILTSLGSAGITLKSCAVALMETNA